MLLEHAHVALAPPSTDLAPKGKAPTPICKHAPSGTRRAIVRPITDRGKTVFTFAASEQPLPNFDEAYRTALEFLGKPHKLWESGGYADKRTVLKLAFSTRISYCRNLGFRTVNPHLALQGVSWLRANEEQDGGPTGVKLGTGF
jgi:hypothetical protein